MAKKTKVYIHTRGANQIRNAPNLIALLQVHAYSALAELGDGYEAEVTKGRSRARARIAAVHPKARNENAKDNTLLKALPAGTIKQRETVKRRRKQTGKTVRARKKRQTELETSFSSVSAKKK